MATHQPDDPDRQQVKDAYIALIAFVGLLIVLDLALHHYWTR